MSTLYAESSAVLRWLLGTPDGPAIRAALSKAATVITSSLTSAEVGRTLRRLSATGALTGEQRDDAWLRFCSAAAHWHLFSIADNILQRVSEPFPLEPVRTLDGIHLATAYRYALEVDAVTMITVDQRLRQNAVGMGLDVLPSTSPVSP